MLVIKIFISLFFCVFFSNFAYSGETDIIAIAGTETGVLLWSPQQPNKDVNVSLKDQEGLYTLNQALRTSGQGQEQRITLGSIVLENDGTLSLLTLNKRVIIRPSVGEMIQDVLMNLAIVHADPSKVVQARAAEILLEMTEPLHLRVQEQLVVKALSDPVPRTYHLNLTVSDRARNILTNVKLDFSIQEELVSIATGFIRPHQKRDLFDRLYKSFFNNEEPLQTRAKEVLIEMKTLDLKVQQEPVRIATSDVAFAAAQNRAQEILIEMKDLGLEAQQELVRTANSDTFLPKIRARKVLTQAKSIHPKIAKSMGISLRCRRAFKGWMPVFAMAQ